MSKENLYLIELYNDNERFFKIGVTVNKFDRFYQLMKFNYRCKIILMIIGLDFYLAYNLESELKELFKPLQYCPNTKFGGYTECFTNIPIVIYKQLMKHLIRDANEIIENLEITWR